MNTFINVIDLKLDEEKKVRLKTPNMTFVCL